MEESKATSLIIAVNKNSTLTDTDIKEYLADSSVHVEAITSPKGFKIVVSSDIAQQLLDKGEDTLKTERVNFAEEDPSCTLYIKGITDKVDEKDLNAALSTEGKICMTSIPKSEDRKPIGIAFVRFNRKADALKAAEKYKTLEINDVKLECSKYAQQSKPRTLSTESATFKNLPTSYTEEEAYKMLSEYGQIAELNLDRESGTGTVSYANHGSVTKAIQGLNGKKLEDQTFLISDNSEKKKKATQYNNLYVGNVDPNVTEEELKEEFGKYGEIESMLRPTRKVTDFSGETKTINKNHVFVSFKDSKAASEVIKELDGRILWGRQLDINYYDSEAKYGPNAKSKQNSSQQMQDLAQSFMQAMVMAAGMANNMNRGRGGYGGQSQGGYRGNNPNYRGGSRGGRGVNRGGRGSRGGMRGGPPGGYQVRSQYEQKPPMMGAHMAPPMSGMGSMGPPPYGSMDPGMGYNPAMHPGHSHGMQAPSTQMQQTPQKMSAPAAAPSSDNDIGASLEELNSMGQDERDNILGTFLYNKLEPLRGGEVAGKIAGMFLDLPTEEVYEIATQEETFQKYFGEALALIEKEGEQD